jgi:hypothetical protein
MVWLWLIAPLILLVVAAALWRLTVRLAAEQRCLQAEIDALTPLGAAARATGTDGAHR